MAVEDLFLSLPPSSLLSFKQTAPAFLKLSLSEESRGPCSPTECRVEENETPLGLGEDEEEKEGSLGRGVVLRVSRLDFFFFFRTMCFLKISRLGVLRAPEYGCGVTARAARETSSCEGFEIEGREASSGVFSLGQGDG